MIDEKGQIILNEKNTLIRKNYWTGLRMPCSTYVGRNWTTFSCLLIITNNKVPLDCIMYLINEFLNWMPAGCWNSYYNSCSVCKCGVWNRAIICVLDSYCSYECIEKEQRASIINEWYNFIDLLDSIKSQPIESIILELEAIFEEDDNLQYEYSDYEYDVRDYYILDEYYR